MTENPLQAISVSKSLGLDIVVNPSTVIAGGNATGKVSFPADSGDLNINIDNPVDVQLSSDHSENDTFEGNLIPNPGKVGQGVTIYLSSDNPSVTVPASIFIDTSGEHPDVVGWRWSSTFQIQTSSLAVDTLVTISASVNTGESVSTTLTVKASVSLGFKFPDFSNATNLLQLNGDAEIVSRALSPVLRLTPARGNAHGSAWYRQQVLFINGFETTFRFKISDPANDGADGFAFVLHNDPHELSALGSVGYALGYQGILNSLAVVFDTWDNGSRSNNRIGVNRNGDVSESGIASLNLSNPNMSDGQEHTVRIRYSSSNGLTIYLNNLSEPVLTVPVELASIFSTGTAYVGFTAATGGAWENHDILSWKFEAEGSTTA